MRFRLLVGLLLIVVLAGVAAAAPAEAQEEIVIVDVPPWPDSTQGTGTHFEVPDSSYLPVALDSSEEVTLSLTSVPEVVELEIEASSGAQSAVFTLSGFLPDTTYYRYMDNETSPTTFVSDANGSFSYVQDLSTEHFLWFQDRPSTLYINSINGGNCSSFGTWNPSTLTCTMDKNVNVSETIWIQSDGITLDGNGRSNNYAGTGSGSNGVYVPGRSNVTVKNLTINGYSTGISMPSNGSNLTVTNNTVAGSSNRAINVSGTNLTISNNSMSGGNYGIAVGGSTGASISNNQISNFAREGISASGATGLMVEDNTVVSSSAPYGIWATGSNNTIANNEFSAGTYGIVAANGSAIRVESNEISGSYYGMTVQNSPSATVAGNNVFIRGIGIAIGNAAGSVDQNVITTASSASSGLNLFNLSGANVLSLTNNSVSGSFNSGLRARDASNWHMTGNTITGAYFGLYLDNGAVSGGAVYQNNFINYTLPFGNNGAGASVINAALPVGGNYYSGYSPTCQNSNSDSFCDIALTFNGITDQYPWTSESGWLVPADSTPPVISASISGTIGDNDWYTSDVTVTWNVTDEESSATYDCPPTTINTDTASMTLTCSASSDGGAASESVTIKRDATAPTAGAILSSSPNSSGWYNSDVTVSYSGADNLSGIASCEAVDVLTSEGQNQTAAGTCTDLAGNVSAPAEVTGINVDKTAPTATASVSPAPNGNGWYNSDVTVSYSGADTLSGIASCEANDVLTSEGQNQTAAGTCTDLAGNVSAPAEVTGINIDKTAPELIVAAPQTLYEVQPLGFALSFSADDQVGLSGLDAASPAAALSNADGSLTASSGFEPAAGVYSVVFSASDLAGNTVTSEEYLLVIYDPDGGFVTGGGWIDSPEGAYADDGLLTGKATFGFVAKYKKGANEPVGNTQFQFKAGDLNFHSGSYDWLVVTGHKAMYKGEGELNGAPGYGFMLSAIDEAQTPSTDVDMFRIKIWEISSGNVVYDNNAGAAEDADPTTAIGGGSIVIHTRG